MKNSPLAPISFTSTSGVVLLALAPAYISLGSTVLPPALDAMLAGNLSCRFNRLVVCSQCCRNPKRKIPCRTGGNASTCYWIPDGFGFYNGTPSFGLWKVGRHRLLGKYSGPSVDRFGLDNESPEFPANIERVLDPINGGRISEDFEVCRLEPEEPGAMQAACFAVNKWADRRITSAKMFRGEAVGA